MSDTQVFQKPFPKISFTKAEVQDLANAFNASGGHETVEEDETNWLLTLTQTVESEGVSTSPGGADGGQSPDPEISTTPNLGTSPHITGPVGPQPTDAREKFFRDKIAEHLGVTKDVAAGIISNFLAESGLGHEFQEQAVALGKGGAGWAQWTGVRRTAFETWAQAQGFDATSDAASFWFFIHEITSVTALKRLLTTLQAGSMTATQAALVFFVGYEASFGNTMADPSLINDKAGHIAQAEHVALL
jgi:hypothetical protein